MLFFIVLGEWASTLEEGAKAATASLDVDDSLWGDDYEDRWYAEQASVGEC